MYRDQMNWWGDLGIASFFKIVDKAELLVIDQSDELAYL